MVRNPDKAAKQKHLIYQWNLDSIMKMSAANPELMPISEEIEVEAIEDGKKVTYPIFKDIKTVNH